MNRALEEFIAQMHADAIDNAGDFEDALREINECADDLDVALEFLDAATWIVQQPVPIRERCRALVALAAVPDHQNCEIELTDDDLGEPVLVVSSSPPCFVAKV